MERLLLDGRSMLLRIALAFIIIAALGLAFAIVVSPVSPAAPPSPSPLAVSRIVDP